MRRIEAYNELVEALEPYGLSQRDLMTQTDVPFAGEQPSGELDYAKIWREAKRRGLKGLPATQEEFERAAYERGDERERDLQLEARGTGVASTLAQFGGEMGGSTVGEPINIASLPVGGVGNTAWARMLSEGAVNAGLAGYQAVTESPEAYANVGQEYGVGDAALEVGGAFAAGAAFRGVGEAVPVIDAAGYRAAAPIRAPIDRAFRERDAARAFSQQVPRHLWTPEQVNAFNVIAREAEIDAGSPYVATAAGNAQHRARLGDATQTLEDIGRPRTASRVTTLNTTIVNFLRQKGYTAGQARGIAAGIHAEGFHGDPFVTNPDSGAFGIGQWLGTRKKELFRRYGDRPSLMEQLEFLHWELRGGDHGGKRVLGAQDEAEVLRRYIVDFMRPKAGGKRPAIFRGGWPRSAAAARLRPKAAARRSTPARTWAARSRIRSASLPKRASGPSAKPKGWPAKSARRRRRLTKTDQFRRYDPMRSPTRNRARSRKGARMDCQSRRRRRHQRRRRRAVARICCCSSPGAAGFRMTG